MKKIICTFLFIFTLAFVSSCTTLTDVERLERAKEKLSFNLTQVTEDFFLPETANYGVKLTWTSNNNAIKISGSYAVVSQEYEDVTVTLSAKFTYKDEFIFEDYIIVVKAKPFVDVLVTVTIKVTVPSNTPTDEFVIIAGDFGSENPYWNPADEWGKATRLSDTLFEFNYQVVVGLTPHTIEYKWTRGDWSSVEKSSTNDEIANRVVTISSNNKTLLIEDVVEKWADLELPVIKSDEEKLNEAVLGFALAKTQYQENFTLPIVGLNSVAISWVSQNVELVQITGGSALVTRPVNTTVVSLQATFSIGELTATKDFIITILGTEPTQDELDVAAASTALKLTVANLTTNINLPNTGTNGTTITWTSSNPESIEIIVDEETGVITGKVTRLDIVKSGINLVAHIQKNDAWTTKTFVASVRASAFTTVVTWIITIPEALPNAVVITTGSSNNSWNPANLDYGIAEKIDATTYKFTKSFTSSNGTNISLQYKWTLQVPGAGFAPWSGEELTLDGSPINNRTLTITRGDMTVENTVVRWRIPVGGTQQSTVVGNLDIVSMKDERLPTNTQVRNIRIWTPAGYDPKDTTKKYPVIYIHDGQNVFDSVTSFAGEWGVDETITTLMAIGGFDGAIVVGIDNNSDRMAEYTYNYEWLSGTKRGHLYMDFIIDIIKPYVDANYQTKTGREDTVLAGSSMGGLISFFGGLARLETFGSIMAYSTSTQQVSNGETNIPALLSSLEPTLLQSTKFFLYVGTNSDGSSTWPTVYRGYLEAAGVASEKIKTYQGVGFTHNEYAWRTHFPIGVEWIFGFTAEKTVLQNFVNTLDYEESLYSSNSWLVYSSALANARAVLENNDATLTEIANAYTNLSSAISQLVLLGDIVKAEEVDDLIVPLPTVANFTLDDQASLQLAIDAYEALTNSQKKLVKFYYVIDLLKQKLATLSG